jgi:inorganic triphosphatase YgiF
MREKDELSKQHTCMQTAHDEEMMFVLLSRDAAAPVALRAWVAERLRLGKNAETDKQIVEALTCAESMESEGRRWADLQLATCGGVTRGLIVRPCELPRDHVGDCGLRDGDGMYP